MPHRRATDHSSGEPSSIDILRMQMERVDDRSVKTLGDVERLSGEFKALKEMMAKRLEEQDALSKQQHTEMMGQVDTMLCKVEPLIPLIKDKGRLEYLLQRLESMVKTSDENSGFARRAVIGMLAGAGLLTLWEGIKAALRH